MNFEILINAIDFTEDTLKSGLLKLLDAILSDESTTEEERHAVASIRAKIDITL